MDPVTGALISGGSSILGGAIQGFWGNQNANSAAAQNQQNAWLNAQWNLAAQQQNQQWLEQMSNTAYQRATKDMRAAGLNPALMYGSGSAASTPGSSPAQMNMPTQRPVAPSADLISPAVHSALSAWNTVETLKKISAETENVKAQNAYIHAQTADTLAHVDVNKTAPLVARAQTENLYSAAFNARKHGEQAAMENVNLGSYGTKEIGPRTFVGGAVQDLFRTYHMLEGQVDPAMPGFAQPAPSAKFLNDKPWLENNRIGRGIINVQ